MLCGLCSLCSVFSEHSVRETVAIDRQRLAPDQEDDVAKWVIQRVRAGGLPNMKTWPTCKWVALMAMVPSEKDESAGSSSAPWCSQVGCGGGTNGRQTVGSIPTLDTKSSPVSPTMTFGRWTRWATVESDCHAEQTMFQRTPKAGKWNTVVEAVSAGGKPSHHWSPSEGAIQTRALDSSVGGGM